MFQRRASRDFEQGVDNFRSVPINIDRPPNEDTFLNNVVVTSQYTASNFVLKNLFKQFKRPANCYFLVICVLQSIGEISITKGVPTTLLPLMCVLLVTALKDASEDYNRHKADRVENNRVTRRYKRGTQNPEEVLWKDVQIGDLVHIKNREMIPADVVIVRSSDTNGLCFVMTANLDGETNLKVRQMHPEFPLDPGAAVNDLTGVVECDLPNKFLERFQGSVSVGTSGSKTALGPTNVMLRGTQLRNTEWAVGVVVYTGHETKIQMNAAHTPFKTSTTSRFTNRETFNVFMVQISLCVLGAILGGVWVGTDRIKASGYLWGDDDPTDPPLTGFVQFWTLIIIFTNFIPISLLVTLDLIKFFQAWLMMQDLECYHEETNTVLQVRSSDLNEELGMVGHVFSDKTGTLTCNVMEFRKCSIYGVSYGLGTTEIGRGVLTRRGLPIPPTPPSGPNDPVTPNVNFVDPSLWAVMSDEQHPNHGAAMDFFTHLAVNHDVMPERLEGHDDVVYSASSPDEGALVNASRHFGLFFRERDPKSVTVHFNGEPRVFKILHTLAFTSTRKRSSVVVETPEGRLVLYCKGADNVIKARLAAGHNDAMMTNTLQHIDAFCDDGLRTLLVARTELDRKWYEEWADRYHVAETSMENRDEKVAAMGEEIEANLQLIGVTAIEDKLQEGVSETITKLRGGGVKVWMLTGDKVDTAINIGFACSLVTTEMALLRVVGEDDDVACDEKRIPLRESITAKLGSVLDTLRRGVDHPAGNALVVDTTALEAVIHYDLGREFLQLCALCKSVICARVSPDQKRQVVSLVRAADPTTVTLSIGDGANDVPMIQTAHVGVGISGQEGLQAVNSSDYAFGQFRFLQRLMLVHGRWSYRRISVVTVYMFYKNALLVLPQFFFGFYCVFSGQNFYYDGLYQVYNIAYTGMPIIILGVLDQDVSAASQLRFPALYMDGINRTFLTRPIFWLWMVEAVWHACVVFFVPLLAYRYGVWDSEGRTVGLWDLGTLVNLNVVTVAHLRLQLDTRSWTLPTVFFVVGSYALWWLSLLIFSGWLELAVDVYGIVTYLIGLNVFWYTQLVTLGMAMVPSLARIAWPVLFSPDMRHVVAEVEKGFNRAGVEEWEARGGSNKTK